MYAAFNARDVDTVFQMLHPDVHWTNGWEGGYVTGYNELRNYWTRQWKEVNSSVEPIKVKDKPNGKIVVEVHQTGKNLPGKILFDEIVKHIYTIENGLI